MLELTKFLNKLTKSDLLVFTVTSERTYCRFFLEGVYVSRMYITDATLLAELLPLVGEEIDAAGINKLKQLYLASDTHSAVDTL
ncbi:hypothetical protein [Pontibacter populi]|uniref:DUF4143 domain-containing protein n=1 Tax=Pontibacter populi TaxID=890055 RepID=A0ABV1RXN6_9BACT